MDRVVSPTPTPLSSGRVVPALVASYDMHGRAVGLFYTQPTGQSLNTCFCYILQGKFKYLFFAVSSVISFLVFAVSCMVNLNTCFCCILHDKFECLFLLDPA